MKLNQTKKWFRSRVSSLPDGRLPRAELLCGGRHILELRPAAPRRIVTSDSLGSTAVPIFFPSAAGGVVLIPWAVRWSSPAEAYLCGASRLTAGRGLAVS